MNEDEEKDGFSLVDPLVTRVFEIYLDKYGREGAEEIRSYIVNLLGLDRASVDKVKESFDSFARLAIERIHHSGQGSSREQAEADLRSSMSFLRDDVFQRFWSWANWCVAKGM